MTRIHNSRRSTELLPKIAAIFLLGLLCGVTLLAQTGTAVISGRVVDPSGAVVPGAAVELKSTETGVGQKTLTNGEGIYNLSSVNPGSYVLSISKPGFRTLNATGLTLYTQDQVSRNFKLEVGSATESITVNGDAELVSTSPAVSTVVDRNFVENMPLNGRSFQTLFMLTPGVVLVPANALNPGQFSVNGQRANANYFTVDGVSANLGVPNGAIIGQVVGGTTPAVSVTGGTNNLVSVDATQEFRIQTSTYAAEFGRQPGGQVSIVTRSGTNQFHGTAFDYFRNETLDANNWFSNNAGLRKPPERQNDFGGVFGGPILKDRTFFFFSYEGLRLQQPHAATTIVPSTASANPALNRSAAPSSIQPILNAFPIPNGPDLGNGFAQYTASYADPLTLNATSIRVDHMFSSKMNLFARYNYSPSNSLVRQTSGLSNVQTMLINTHTFTVGVTNAISSKVNNEFRANLSNVKGRTSYGVENFGGAVPMTDTQLFPSGYTSANGIVLFSFTGVGSLIQGKNIADEQRQLNFVDNFSMASGPHQVKVGVDYRWLSPIYSPAFYSQSVTFSGMTGPGGALSGVPSFLSVSAIQGSTALARSFSLYGQDTWKATPRLTFTYGLRWDINLPITGKDVASVPYAVQGINNPATMTLQPRGTPLYATTYGNFAPRVGAAYQLVQSQNWATVLRGGFGVFYDLGYGYSGQYAANAFPFTASKPLTGAAYPLTAAQAAAPAFSVPPPVTSTFYAVDPNLKLPRTYQWNAAIEQSFGPNQTFSATYVGAVGRGLIRNDSLNGPNPSFTSLVVLIRNTATSDYHALQLQFQRRVSHGLQAIASYTWSHSLDIASTDSATNNPSSTLFSVALDRGSSDFDIRHSFSGALTYDIPAPWKSRAIRMILGGWSVDDLMIGRTPPPLNLSGPSSIFAGTQFTTRPNVISGIPFYLYGSQYPGGKIINNTIPTAAQVAAAGCIALAPAANPTNAKGAFCTPPTGTLGNLPRNALRSFGAWQDNFSVRRQFHLTEKVGMQFRAEFFNVTNHPNFGILSPTNTTLTNAFFGRSTQMLANNLGTATGGFNALYQIGGPRSIQLALKLTF